MLVNADECGVVSPKPSNRKASSLVFVEYTSDSLQQYEKQ
jgi:hypothetical protein